MVRVQRCRLSCRSSNTRARASSSIGLGRGHRTESSRCPSGGQIPAPPLGICGRSCYRCRVGSGDSPRPCWHGRRCRSTSSVHGPNRAGIQPGGALVAAISTDNIMNRPTQLASPALRGTGRPRRDRHWHSHGRVILSPPPYLRSSRRRRFACASWTTIRLASAVGMDPHATESGMSHRCWHILYSRNLFYLCLTPGHATFIILYYGKIICKTEPLGDR